MALSSGSVQSDEFEEYCPARGLLYDTLVRYVDEQIERTLNSIVDIDDTRDERYGEEFWEYKNFEQAHFDDSRGISGVGHGHALVPPVLEVPIVANIGSTPP